MFAESSRSPSSGPVRSGASKPLKRGKACSVCRTLKIKCDGQKPMCGPCMKGTKADPCEYDNGLGKSRTRYLEETVARLEARVYELENPDAATPSVTLHDPYINHNSANHTPPIPTPEPSHLGRLSPFSPTSTTSSLPSGRHWHNFASLEAMTQITGSTTSMSPSRQLLSVSSASLSDEPPQGLRRFLVENFLQHAIEFGFFLEIPSFSNSALLPHRFGDSTRPTPALLTTAYLWGTHLTPIENSALADESDLLFRALRYVVTDTLGDHPKRIMHTLQAEILLSTYFFRIGRFLEAKCHLNSAVSLALSAQLHKVRSVNLPPLPVIGLRFDKPIQLQHPHTPVEEGEYINGFWAVYTLHKLLSVALEPPGGLCGALEAPGLQIDTPWPLASRDYANEPLGTSLQGNSTIKVFLAGYISHCNDASLNALLVKASILCHRATHLSGQWGPAMSEKENESFFNIFYSISQLIEDFRGQIPSLHRAGINTANTRTIILIHNLSKAAIIKLHGTFSYADINHNQKCMQAACDMVKFGEHDLQNIGFVNPVHGTLWQMACQVFIDEMSRRKTSSSWLPTITDEQLEDHLQAGRRALHLFAKECAFIRYQHLKVEEAYKAINTINTSNDYLQSSLHQSQ